MRSFRISFFLNLANCSRNLTHSIAPIFIKSLDAIALKLDRLNACL
ncbi:MAG: hypothetical protein F6K28_59855 [Microcoleus sp. SIO2G3]|nr:hypothetical protein [Microcoleus sp. SIO2G3]